MASYADIGQIARSDEFQRRVAVAMNNAAANIYSESNTVTGHAARAAFATKVATGNYSLSAACLLVLGQTNIGAEAILATVPGNSIPDTDIQSAVNGLWNCMAGA